MSKTKSREEMIKFLFNENYIEDDPKYDASNMAYLETQSTEELEDMIFQTKLFLNQG